ncbi:MULTISPECIES: hypothetical protein [unclassified Blastococcus]
MTALDSLRLLLDAANAEDTEGFLGSFAADAVVDDDGRLFQGLLQIAEWNLRTVIGVRARFHVLGITEVPGGAAADVEIGGGGRNGRGRLTAQLQGGEIQVLTLRPQVGG